MVIVQYEKDGWARVYLRGPHRGAISTKITYDFPIRTYVKTTKNCPGHWRIPQHMVEGFREWLKKKNPGITLIVEKEVQKNCEEYKKYISTLKKIQLEGLNGEDPGVKIPGFKGKLPNFQQTGVKFLNYALRAYKFNKSALLGDVVGLGKTVQAIALALWLKKKKKIDLVLAVVPASLKIKWGQEINKFSDLSWNILKTESQIGGTGYYREQFMDLGTFFFIINYDIIYRMEEDLLALLDSGNSLLILDECQYVKNASALRSKSAVKLGEAAKYVVEMSATFLENSVIDLFNVFRVMNPLILGDVEGHFVKRYQLTDWMGKPIGTQNTQELHEIISPFIIRRRKEQIREQLSGLIANKIIETNIMIQLTPKHRKIYNEVKSGVVSSLKKLERADKIKQAELLALIQYLRQAALSTALVDAEIEISSKLNYLLEFIEGFDKDAKVVIFCYFVKMVEHIGFALNKKGYPTHVVHAQNTTKTERAKIVNNFLVDDKRVLVASDVLRVGQDLYSAAYLVNFDLLWNPRAMDQRKGRIDRVGQENEILYMYNLIAEDTIEERMLEVIKYKDDLFTELAESGEKDVRLTVKRLKGLLEMELES